MNERIGIFGTGYVGLTTAVGFGEWGHRVTAMDINPEKIASLWRGEVPFYEPGMSEALTRAVAAGNLRFTNDLVDTLSSTDLLFVAVGTPMSDDGSADLSAYWALLDSMLPHLRSDQVVVIKSTVPVGTGRKTAAYLAERLGRSQPVVNNPEFLREGQALTDVRLPDRVVLGSLDETALQRMADLYRPLQVPILLTDPTTAETVKYAANAFLATRISFVNELARLTDATGADIDVVAEGMGLDRRVGPHFLRPGPGYGGSCFPKDLAALRYIGLEHGVEMPLLSAVAEVNRTQPQYVVERLRERLGSLAGQRIALLGLAFKPGTDDMRESPAIPLVSLLQREGAEVVGADPVAADNAARLLGIAVLADPYAACSGADAAILVTEWPVFAAMDLERITRLLGSHLLYDTRRVIAQDAAEEAGLRLLSLGRQTPQSA